MSTCAGRPASRKIPNNALTRASVPSTHSRTPGAIVVEWKVFVATFWLILITWLLYKLAEWLEPKK